MFEKNSVYNHYGVWISKDQPITGVLSNNTCTQFISDEICGDSINLDYEDHLNSEDHTGEDCEICEYWEDYDSTYLIGDWIKDEDGLYDYDPNGEYAAIVREIYTQVVFSRYTVKSALCSPCYPGQGDLDSTGDFIAYTLPPGAFEY